jgi:hypothetical protein
MGESKQNLAVSDIRRIKSRETFLYFLDLEVKRARRYQDFFSIILLKLIKSSRRMQEVATETHYQTLTKVLAEEIRETDVLGVMQEDKIAILLPYANEESAELAQSRFHNFLKPYDFKSKGCEIEFKRFCFPLDGVNTADILKKVINIPS